MTCFPSAETLFCEGRGYVKLSYLSRSLNLGYPAFWPALTRRKKPLKDLSSRVLKHLGIHPGVLRHRGFDFRRGFHLLVGCQRLPSLPVGPAPFFHHPVGQPLAKQQGVVQRRSLGFGGIQAIAKRLERGTFYLRHLP